MSAEATEEVRTAIPASSPCLSHPRFHGLQGRMNDMKNRLQRQVRSACTQRSCFVSPSIKHTKHTLLTVKAPVCFVVSVVFRLNEHPINAHLLSAWTAPSLAVRHKLSTAQLSFTPSRTFLVSPAEWPYVADVRVTFYSLLLSGYARHTIGADNSVVTSIIPSSIRCFIYSKARAAV